MVQDKYYGYRDAALFSEFVISSLFTTSSVPSTPSTKTVPTVGAPPPTPPSGSPTQQTPAPLNGMPKEGIDTPPASPESRSNKKSTTTTTSGSGSTGPSNIPPLAEFIAYALYRTRLPSTITHLSLCLLTRLKKLYPLARGTPTSPHRLFLSALMLASKITMDDTYSNKSWVIVAGSVWEVKEVNQMERELFAFLGWNVVVGKEELEGWESKWFAEWDVEKESRKVAAKNASVERKRRRTNSVDVVVEPSQQEVAANNVASSSSAGSSSSRCSSPMAVDEPNVTGSSSMWESRAKGSSRHRRAADAARALLRPSSSSSSSEMKSPTFSTSSSGSSSSSSFPAESPYSSCSRSNPTSPMNVRHASSSSSSLSSMAGGFGSNRTRQHSHSRNPRKQSQSLSHTSSPYNSRRLSFPSGTMTGTSSQHVSAISSPVEPHHHHYTLPRNYSSSSTFISSATTSPSFDEMSSSPGAETPVTPQSVGPRTPDHYPNQFYPSSMSMYSKPGGQHHWDPHSPFHHPQSGTTSPSPPSIYRPSSYYAAATAPAVKAVQHGMGIWNSYVGVPTHHQNQPQSHPGHHHHHHHHHQGSASQGQVQMNLGMGVHGVPGLDSMGMEPPAGW